MSTDKFTQWLIDQMNFKNLNQIELAQKTGLSTSQISRILSGFSTPSLETLVLLAKGLSVSKTEILYAVGTLTPEDDFQVAIERVGHKFSQLSDHDQDEILALIDFKLQQAQNARRKKTGPLGGTT